MKHIRLSLAALAVGVVALFSSSCAILPFDLEELRFARAETDGQISTTPGFRSTGAVEHGIASWYEIKCNGGTHTASGETLNNWADTAAHKTLPMGTHVKVTNLANGMEKVVRINDRGPYISGRVIDVTVGVAHELEFVNRGVVPVNVEILEPVGSESG